MKYFLIECTKQGNYKSTTSAELVAVVPDDTVMTEELAFDIIDEADWKGLLEWDGWINDLLMTQTDFRLLTEDQVATYFETEKRRLQSEIDALIQRRENLVQEMIYPWEPTSE